MRCLCCVRCVQRLVLVGDARVYSTGVQSHIFKVWRRPATFPTFWIIKHEKTVCKFPSKSAAGVVIMVVRRLNLILPQNPTPVRKNSEIEPWSGLWLWFRSASRRLSPKWFVAQTSGDCVYDDNPSIVRGCLVVSTLIVSYPLHSTVLWCGVTPARWSVMTAGGDVAMTPTVIM